jgi:hypothetical protein
MSHYGQSSQGFQVGQSHLRILHVGNRTSLGTAVADSALTQTNPPTVSSAGTVSTQLPSNPKDGVLGGSIALTRPDLGSGLIGGPDPNESDPGSGDIRPLGIFIKDAAGYDYQNQPTSASGKATYISGQGTYGSALFETQDLNGGSDLTYQPGDYLYCSRNGYLTNQNNANNALELQLGYTSATVLGVVKIAPDSEVDEITFDLRI